MRGHGIVSAIGVESTGSFGRNVDPDAHHSR